MRASMRYFTSAVIFSFFVQFGILSCSRDLNNNPRFRKEVEDFEDYLRRKVEKEAISKRAHSELSLGNSENVPDPKDYFDSNEQGTAHFGKFGSEGLSPKSPYSEKHSKQHEEIFSRESLDSLSRSGGVQSQPTLEKQHRPVEEIVIIRRSDTDSNDPLRDVIDTLVHDGDAKGKTTRIRRHRPEPDPTDERSSDDTCLPDNLTSNLDQTCSDGPEYEMQFHPKFSETLKQDMETMLPDLDPEESKCDYDRELTVEAGVEDRALCPFTWSIGNRNPSRIPEYLYEAKCACQISRKIRGKKSFECREVKRVIPVLWVTECGPGAKKKYRQGWEEIAVACAPLEEKDSNVVPNTQDTT